MIPYGKFVDDTSEDLVSNSGLNLSFGLNRGTLTKFEITDEYLDVFFQVKGVETNARYYAINKVFNRNGEITDTTSEEYRIEVEKAYMQLSASITHIFRIVGYTPEKANVVANENHTSFKSWVTSVAAKCNNPQGVPVDLFVTYNSKGYLSLPSNMKGGYFIVPQTNDEWVEKRSWEKDGVQMEGLAYVNSANQFHPFLKSFDYIQRVEEYASQRKSSNSTATTATVPASQAASDSSNWDSA